MYSALNSPECDRNSNKVTPSIITGYYQVPKDSTVHLTPAVSPLQFSSAQTHQRLLRGGQHQQAYYTGQQYQQQHQFQGVPRGAENRGGALQVVPFPNTGRKNALHINCFLQKPVKLAENRMFDNYNPILSFCRLPPLPAQLRLPSRPRRRLRVRLRRRRR